jgi:threonine/homoserine/homoserine lactone efflux protein
VIDPLLLLTFLPAALALNLTPGADMMFCLGQGLRGGPRPAIAASAGISAGCFVHVTLAALGLGALVAAHPGAFDVIRWAGVAYLLWLAWRTLTASQSREPVPAVSPARAFRDGLLVNLANPKVILFVLALLPQFTDPTAPLLPQFLLLGGVLSLGGFVINGLVGVFASGIGRGLARSPRLSLWMGRITAAIFVSLAARLAFLTRS